MKTTALYLPPETLLGHTVTYHPFCDLICAGGEVDESGAITWLVPQYEPGSVQDEIASNPSPAVNENITQSKATDASYMPTKPEFLLPLNSVSCARFSPDGRFLAVIGPETDKDRLFIYSIQLPKLYSSVTNTMLRPFLRLELQQHFLNELAWAPDSSSVVVGSQNGQVSIVPVRTHMPMSYYDNDKIRVNNNIYTIKCVAGNVMGISWSQDGYLIAVQGCSELQILVKKITRQKVSFCKGAHFSKTSYVFGVEQAPGQLQDAFLPKGSEKYMIEQKSLRTFYAIALYKRQCAFSPDASFLIATAGFLPVASAHSQLRSQTFCTYVFSKRALCTFDAQPSIILPGHRNPSVAVAFSPVLYELDPSQPNVTDLTYRMLFAVTSGCDCTIYDTQSFQPVAHFDGESFQLDYLISLSFNATGSQLCAFGAYFQYQFFNIPEDRFKRLQVSFKNLKFQQILYYQAIARQKVQYVQKMIDFQTNKIKSKPQKPQSVQLGEIQCCQRVKTYSVSELFQHDLQMGMPLQISTEEIAYLEELLKKQETVKEDVQEAKPTGDVKE